MTQPQTTTQPQTAATADRLVQEAEERVREQEARLRSMIVQGAPIQSAEDLLTQLHTTLQQMKEHRRLSRGAHRLPSSPRASTQGRRGPLR